MGCQLIGVLTPADDTTDGTLPSIVFSSSFSLYSASLGRTEDFPTVPVQLLVAVKKPDGGDGFVDEITGGKVWPLIFARLFLARGIVDGAGAGLCEFNLSWTIERSERKRKRFDAGFRVIETCELVLFPEESRDGTTMQEEAIVAGRVEARVAVRE